MSFTTLTNDGKAIRLEASNLEDFWSTEDHFLMELINELSSRNVLLHLLATNKEKLVEYMKVYDSFACCDHKTGGEVPEWNDPLENSSERQRSSG